MATETSTTTTAQIEENAWQYGVVGGVIAGLVMGALMVMQMRPVIEVAIPSMYFLSGGAAGFTIHVAHGAVLGVVFAAIASTQADLTAVKSLALGVGYGVVLWVVLAVLVIPGAIYLWPAGGTVLGAHYRTAMLVLPMVPAVLLGVVAVWSMKNRR